MRGVLIVFGTNIARNVPAAWREASWFAGSQQKAKHLQMSTNRRVFGSGPNSSTEYFTPRRRHCQRKNFQRDPVDHRRLNLQ